MNPIWQDSFGFVTPQPGPWNGLATGNGLSYSAVFAAVEYLSKKKDDSFTIELHKLMGRCMHPTGELDRGRGPDTERA